MHGRLERAILQQWYATRPGWSLLFAPLSWLFKGVTGWRYRRHCRQRQPFAVPLLVVGNITVGGTGKTPLVIALCQAFSRQGLKVVVISRGYGSAAPAYPYVVTPQSTASDAGDEPFLMARRTGATVIIAADRLAAAQRALDWQPDIIISDDGLQHYRLPRTAEVVVIDGERGLGNGWCLPTGPLRDSAARFEQVDQVVINGGDFAYPSAVRMQLQPGNAINLLTGDSVPLAQLKSFGRFNAVAGIGNPERFFATLERQGLDIVRRPFADHHAFDPADLDFGDGNAVIMTEKDGVKCADFAKDNYWYLPVDAVLPDGLVANLLGKLLPEQ